MSERERDKKYDEGQQAMKLQKIIISRIKSVWKAKLNKNCNLKDSHLKFELKKMFFGFPSNQVKKKTSIS